MDKNCTHNYIAPFIRKYKINCLDSGLEVCCVLLIPLLITDGKKIPKPLLLLYRVGRIRVNF